MRLIAVYIIFVLAGTLIAAGVGEITEIWSEQASLFVFLALFFASLWAGWKLALKFTLIPAGSSRRDLLRQCA